MNRFTSTIIGVLITSVTVARGGWKPLTGISDIYVSTTTCNSYAIKQGVSAVLVDLGDASDLQSLATIGIQKIDHLLLTGHHRELHQGIGKMTFPNCEIAAPEAERDFFESPTQFRKWHPKLGDRYTVHGASYVRPPATSLPVKRWLKDGEIVSWREWRIECISTPGHSPGGMSYQVSRNNKSALLSGGLMHDGARMPNWFDTEWDYGFAKGIDALIASVEKLSALGPNVMLPSFGPPIESPNEQLPRYIARLNEFRADYVRGYPVDSLSKRSMHPAVKATAVPNVVQVTPHLYMFGPEMAGKNFAIVIADSGHALLLDCGLFPRLMFQKLVSDMKQHLGLKQIDACWISHMHGDHFTLAPAMKEMGIKLWTMDTIVDKCEKPRAYDYPAMIVAYGDGFKGTTIDRVFKSGDVVNWEGYDLHIDWMPGQTKFGNALWLELDGQKIVFTGDNLFGDPTDIKQDGHECVVARNNALIDEGYLVAARYLRQLKPDIIMGAHSVLMTQPQAFIDRYHAWSLRMIGRFKELLPDSDYAYLFDPFWVQAYPYRADLTKTRSQVVQITVRNFRDHPQRHEVTLKLPSGLRALPATLKGTVAAKSSQTYPVEIRVDTSEPQLPAK